MGSYLMDPVIEWFAEQVLKMISGLLAFLTSGMFLSPDVTGLPQVRHLADKAAMVVNASFVLAIIAAGVMTMTASTVEMRFQAKAALPRLVVAFVASVFALPLTSALVTTANALTVAMVGQESAAGTAIESTKAHLSSILSNPLTLLVGVVIGLLVVGLGYYLAVSWIVRVFLLVILASIAPFAMACYCLEAASPVAQLWWRSVLGCLGTPTLQATTLSAGMGLLTTSDANLPIILGLPATDMVNLLIVVVILWVTVKIPSLMRRFVTQHGGPNVGGVIVRTVFVQSLTSRLR
ncbi:hypothetical protein [Catellatospora chokoriensis]|uniref:Uncharacterized protein n=1 Tax=Catellatospora chokoriensis TaxID=310353 RepID=A0A8J3K5F0_9ACTN|nr:hypothetical protein [Catellatospora chokoriensis]GIF89809.1 hypothetical protein Cch02nite_32530 [Catellatospora chokoriensis]